MRRNTTIMVNSARLLHNHAESLFRLMPRDQFKQIAAAHDHLIEMQVIQNRRKQLMLCLCCAN